MAAKLTHAACRHAAPRRERTSVAGTVWTAFTARTVAAWGDIDGLLIGGTQL
jgi:hypothetical protein